MSAGSTLQAHGWSLCGWKMCRRFCLHRLGAWLCLRFRLGVYRLYTVAAERNIGDRGQKTTFAGQTLATGQPKAQPLRECWQYPVKNCLPYENFWFYNVKHIGRFLVCLCRNPIEKDFCLKILSGYRKQFLTCKRAGSGKSHNPLVLGQRKLYNGGKFMVKRT